MNNWYLEYYEKKQKCEKKQEEFHNKINSFNNKIDMLKFLYNLDKENYCFKYSMSRTCTIIYVWDKEIDDYVYTWYFSHGLGWMHSVIFEFWKNRCASCKISEDEAYKKYGMGLELHHTTPMSFYEDMSETTKSPLEMFEPRCHNCHPRGYQ